MPDGGWFEDEIELDERPAKGRRVVPDPVLTVTQVTGLVQAFLGNMERVAVEGELVGKVAASGHYYGRLRDGDNVLDVVMWRSALARLGEVPADGTQVVLYGVDDLVVVAREGLVMVTRREKATDLKTLLDALPAEVRGL